MDSTINLIDQFIYIQRKKERKPVKIDLNGSWELENDKFGKMTVSLPGTLDENKVGDQDVVAKLWHKISFLR